MQIVIDIDENLYTRLFDNGGTDAVDMLNACVAIRKGKPLPKGHGRLIDADMLWDLYHDNGYDFYEALDDVQTIIEADKAESED